MSQRPLLVVLALAGPLAVAGALVPFRAEVDDDNAALLVIVVVAVAACGDRLMGVLAAVSRGCGSTCC